MSLGDLMPESRVAGGEERIFAGVPAKKMWRAGVRGVMVAGFPDFVEEKSAGLFDAAMQIKTHATVFFARGSDEGAQLGFQKQVLSLFGAHDHHQGDRVLRKPDNGGVAGTPAGGAFYGSAGSRFGHDRGDCTPNAREGKRN